MIGIVGGVGPYAGIDLLKKVYDSTLANSDQEHLATLLLSLPEKINDRTEYLEGRVNENPAIAISEIILKLQNCGATHVGIPCNTAHSKKIFNEITTRLINQRSSVKLLNMIEETLLFISETYPGISGIGILSTTGTYKSKIYEEPLNEKGFKVIKPTLQMQEELIHPAIYDSVFGIKTVSNPIHRQAIENLKKGVAYLKKEGAEVIILGCTEIPLAFPQKVVDGIETIDPTRILARALVRSYAPEKLKPF